MFNAINFSPALFSLYPTNFDKLYFHFYLFKHFSISLEICSFTHVLFRSVLFNVHVFGDFTIIFLLLISSLFPLWLESRHGMTSIVFDVLSVFHGQEHGPSWQMFHVSLKRMYIFLLLDEVAYRCQLCPVD